MKPETDPKVILALLEKKGRAGAPELGTDTATMYQIEKSGAIRRDGKIFTGKRGKPPIAWVIADGKTPEEIAEIEIQRPKPAKQKQEEERPEAFQEKMDKALAQVKAGPYAHDCHCVVELESFPAHLIRTYTGCKTDYICGALTNLRIKTIW